MEKVNRAICCEVSECVFNSEGKNCTLDRIVVGCGCNEENCTCCENYKSR